MSTYRGVRSSVSYPRADISGSENQPVRITLIQEMNRHDILFVDHRGLFQFFRDSVQTGTPIQALSRSPLGVTNWFGYVEEVMPIDESPIVDNPAAYSTDTAASDYSVTTSVMCIGLTFPLKTTAVRVYENHPVSDVVESRILAAGLTPLVTPSSLVQTIPQAGRSDWTMLSDLAKITGRVMFNTGTTMNWLSIKDVFTHYADSAPRLTHISKASILGDIWAMRTYTEDYSDNSSHDEDGWVTATALSGVDPVSNTVVTSTQGNGLFTKYLTETARSSQSVDEKIAASRELVFSRQAVTGGMGNPYVSAGRPVYMYSPHGAEWWLVKKVVHTWLPRTRAHSMELTLVKRDDDAFPTDIPSKFPQVNTSRRSPHGCLHKEHQPHLAGGVPLPVTGSGKWGTSDRWTVSACD